MNAKKYHKEVKKQETAAFVNPPNAWITLGIYILSVFLAKVDFANVGKISPYILTQSKNIFHCCRIS